MLQDNVESHNDSYKNCVWMFLSVVIFCFELLSVFSSSQNIGKLRVLKGAIECRDRDDQKGGRLLVF